MPIYDLKLYLLSYALSDSTSEPDNLIILGFDWIWLDLNNKPRVVYSNH